MRAVQAQSTSTKLNARGIRTTVSAAFSKNVTRYRKHRTCLRTESLTTRTPRSGGRPLLRATVSADSEQFQSMRVDSKARRRFHLRQNRREADIADLHRTTAERADDVVMV
jgi:hypothetical protein